jgi:hypothetical protein
VKENLVRSHVTELGAQADLGEKPKSVQPIRGEVYSARGQTGENPVLKHVDELQWQATLKGEPAPFQPIPEEQEAVERLGKPPPEGVRGGFVFFRGHLPSLRSQRERILRQRLHGRDDHSPDPNSPSAANLDKRASQL